MAGKSIIYQHPFLYFISLKLFNRCDSRKLNQYINSLIYDGETVLEPACGAGSLAKVFSKKISYLGFDINQQFVNYGLKRGLNLCLGDVLDKSSYKKAEVVISYDTLHHLKLRNRKEFINHSYSSATRLFIFCDCVRVENSWKRGMYLFYKTIFEFLERDGTNKPKYKDFYTKEQLQKEIKNGFGVIPENIKREIRQFGDELLVVFRKKS